MWKHKKNTTQKRVPTTASSDPSSFRDSVQILKKSVYLIARGRTIMAWPTQVPQIKWVTIGTGFIAAPRRFVTAAHVIDVPGSSNEWEHSKEWDKYYLIQHDDEWTYHYRCWEPKIWEDIFLYPEVDLAVINLEEEFYTDGASIYKNKDVFIRIDPNFNLIWSEVGVLGYPLCELNFMNNDMNTPQVGNVLLRCDKWVINCRYSTSTQRHHYEFTIAFNPGNSWGPIFDVKTWKIVSIVHGYRAIPIKIQENNLTSEQKPSLGIVNYPLESYLNVVNASYSIGFATPSFTEIFKKHDIL